VIAITAHRWKPRHLLIALLSAGGVAMADLLVRGVDDALVQALKQRAGAHGRSAEAEHRAILAAALLMPPRQKLAELLASMPDVGSDADFQRPAQTAEAADVFG
jgi:plasmid stability protein